MKHLILGTGEVGKAILNLTGGTGIDKSVPKDVEKALSKDKFDVLHVSFPYSPSFVAHVRDYKRKYLKTGGLVIIHSSIPVGTTVKCGKNAVHSPIRGVHPHLEEGIKTFVKYFGGKEAQRAAKIMKACGVNKSVTTLKAEETEALKLWDTTYYGWNIVFMKAVYAFCKKHKLSFDLVYSSANLSYNDGYKELGRPEVVRPVLKPMPGKIGGHCIMNNAQLLNDELAKMLIKANKKLK
jgi:UDP-N-acetyl-D-mannosaminuronate dehydrogenase